MSFSWLCPEDRNFGLVGVLFSLHPSILSVSRLSFSHRCELPETLNSELKVSLGEMLACFHWDNGEGGVFSEKARSAL